MIVKINLFVERKMGERIRKRKANIWTRVGVLGGTLVACIALNHAGFIGKRDVVDYEQGFNFESLSNSRRVLAGGGSAIEVNCSNFDDFCFGPTLAFGFFDGERLATLQFS